MNRDDETAAVFDALPAEIVERTGRMHASGGRLVLAMVDRDPNAVDELIDAIASYDDAPDRRPYPGPRFLTADPRPNSCRGIETRGDTPVCQRYSCRTDSVSSRSQGWIDAG